MNKGRSIRIAILSVIFVLAIILFGILTNRGSVGLTADMSSPTLPTISFQVAGKEVNTLVGHKKEMDFVAVRDVITVFEKSETLSMNIKQDLSGIQKISYDIQTLDEKEVLYQGEVEKIQNSIKLKVGAKLANGQEAVLKICMTYNDTPIYYYTRIVKNNNYHVKECVEYVEELHTNILKKKNEDAVKKVMEPNAQGNNKTLQHVTIHSDMRHVMWGNLKPELINSVQYEIKEVKEAYTSVLLRYQVECSGSYYVNEFFKVAYGTERVYLLEYDRTVEEVFDTSNKVLSSKGVLLGITDSEVDFRTNEDGTIVAFVKANELWSYSKTENSFSLVFSFVSRERYDERNYTDYHSVKILSMENNGNMTFSVSGYMNRGDHEGDSGVVIYYYQKNQGHIEEIAFIPSTASYLVREEILNESAYYNQAQNAMYLLSGGALSKVTLQGLESNVLVENLEQGKYVASDDGHLFAYQKNVDGNITTEVWDFEKDSKTEITVDEGLMAIPLGFIGTDFVYGISRIEDVGYDMSGKQVQAMHVIEIRNEKNEIVKQYKQDNTYVLSASVRNNMVTLTQGVKVDSRYKETSEDYITNNEVANSATVELKSYWTDLKETQYSFAFSQGVKDSKVKVLKPKQLLQEGSRTIDLEEQHGSKYYYVFGHGKLAGVFLEASDAIELANQLAGVVVSSEQNYVWEADNKAAYYRNFNINGFVANANESALTTCVKKILAYEGKETALAEQLGEKLAEEVLGMAMNTEGIRFRDCSVKSVFYLIDKGVPIIGLKNNTNAIVIIGYDAQTATYIDPANGGIYRSNIEKVDEMLEGSGNTLIGYIR